MLLALSNKELISPTKNRIAQCPLCNVKVIAKCGEINIHHWAHYKKEGCDSWSEPETYWHKSWKESFPIQNREVVMNKNGIKHFADIFTNNQIIIELQNSNISSETIRERELFYGDRLLWVINAGRYRDHIRVHPNKEIEKLLSGIKPKYWYYEIFLSDDYINDFLSTSKEFTFSWKYPIRSWLNSKRPVFLDINENYMLWFYKGIGTDFGKFKVYPKNRFFEKYEGDYTRFKKLNETKNLYDFKEIVSIIQEAMWSYNKEFSNYIYPPYPSLKIYNNLTKKTCLQKVRFNTLIIPNGNSKGLYFLFCQNIINPEKLGVYFGCTINKSIKEVILEVIDKNNSKLFYEINTAWRVEYISSIPLNKIDSKNLSKSLLNHINSEVLIKTNELKNIEIIKPSLTI